MARLVDLDNIDPDDAEHHIRSDLASVHVGTETPDDDNNACPNARLLSAALVCYPVAAQLAGYLDLNTLHDLSRTCRQVRASLLQYSSHLKTRTLHCENENVNPAQRLGNALHASFKVWTAYGQNGTQIGRITSGKLGACSRDMVGDCRRCAKIICRNCIMKQPPQTTFKTRLRRLCRTCVKSPLSQHTTVPLPTPHSPETLDHEDPSSSHHISRTPCSCPQTIWICQTCSQALRVNDTTYIRSWNWRARYSSCGGIGAGLGEGNEGVECGRNRDFKCLGAREVEQEYEMEGGDGWQGGGYMTHEVVGIGGKVKKKVRRVVHVGEVVKEYEDERVSGKFLEREQSGANRSWCSWCARVVLGKKDYEREIVLVEGLQKTVSIEST